MIDGSCFKMWTPEDKGNSEQAIGKNLIGMPQFICMGAMICTDDKSK